MMVKSFYISDKRYFLAFAFSELFQILMAFAFIYLSFLAHSPASIFIICVLIGSIALSIYYHLNQYTKAINRNRVLSIDISESEIVLTFRDLTKRVICNDEIDHIDIKRNKFKFLIVRFLLFIPYFNFKDLTFKLKSSEDITLDSYLFDTNKIYASI